MKLLLGCFVFVCIWYAATFYLSHQLTSDFDTQNLTLWQVTARSGMLPVRDVFYPYGLLFYYQQSSLLACLGVLLLSSISLFACSRSIIYFGRTKMISWFSIIFLLILLVRFIGFETWSRYGITLAATLWFWVILESSNLKKVLGLGLAVGLLFGLIQDQALYCAVIFCLGVVLSKNHIPKRIGWFGIGTIIGLIPYVVYLLLTHGLSPFLEHWLYLREIGLAAKAPFIPFAFSASNTFVFIVLFWGLCFVSFRILVLKRPLTHYMMTLSLLMGYIILLEQKSFLRSIDWQIVLPAGVLFLLLLVRSRTRSFYVIGLLILIICFYPFRALNIPSEKNNLARDYQSIVNYLNKFPDYNGKLFSYPGDPILYQFSGQRPPYYFTSYEATPRDAQAKMIAYIEDQHINYVIYDLRLSAIQDGVPNYIRNRTELAFLLTHFQAQQKLGNFLILHRSIVVDPKKICAIATGDALCTWLSEIDLGNIPATEGMKQLSQNHAISYPFFSEHQYLLLQTSALVPNIRLTLTTENDETLRMQMKGCRLCVVNLDAMPGLYFPKRISNITSNVAGEMRLMLMPPDVVDFW